MHENINHQIVKLLLNFSFLVKVNANFKINEYNL